jgi:hypothetical protein
MVTATFAVTGRCSSSKHFLGHGDTDTDCTSTGPVNAPIEPLPELPSGYQAGLTLMIAHVAFPRLSPTPRRSTTSRPSRHCASNSIQGRHRLRRNGDAGPPSLSWRGTKPRPRGRRYSEAGQDMLELPSDLMESANGAARQ